MDRVRKPWWQYINLLGLDAPFVAVLWLFLFAKTWRVDYHPWQVYVALGLIAWTVRVTMKILEGVMIGDAESFHVLHRKLLTVCAVLSGLGGLTLTVLNFPFSGYNYLLAAMVPLIGYFALSLFSSDEGDDISYGKHALGGLSFSMGTALMAHAYLPSLEIQMLFLSREFIAFALLCVLASAAIEFWSRHPSGQEAEGLARDELALSLPLTLLGAAALVFAVQNDSMTVRPFFYGILTGAALLQVLNRMNRRFSQEDLKVLAGVCLLIPGVIFQAYEMSQ
ncbi:MAG: hypothetical protein AB8D78_10035 [Akkermansiaceae bacterium]